MTRLSFDAFFFFFSSCPSLKVTTRRVGFLFFFLRF